MNHMVTKTNYCAFLRLTFLVPIIISLIELSDTHKSISDIPSTCPIYLTLSPLSKNAEDSLLEINWGPACTDPPEWIGVYTSYPSIGNSKLLGRIYTHGNHTGSVQSNIKLGKFDLPIAWTRSNFTTTSEKCFSYFAAGYKEEDLHSLTCLVIEPMWMSLIPHISSVPLKDLMIPGTHCSGCYYNRLGSRKILMKKFGFTQDFDVWTQLVLGIRYLDISVGYQESKGNHNAFWKFWIVSEGIFITPLLHIFEDIKKFVQMTGETVIVDFNAFPLGFYNHPHRHTEFLKFLEIEFGEIAYRRNDSNSVKQSYDLTLHDLNTIRRNLLISYNVPELVKESNLLWPSWPRYTTNDVAIGDVQEYMRRLFTRKHEASPKSNGWVFVGIQGVESTYSSNHSLLTVRERANNMNKILNTRLGGPWSLKANIVAIDFFMSTNLIDIAIHTNRHKSFELNEKKYIHFDIQN